MDVEEVMRACGGAVQGIKDRGCYHNRGNDGWAPHFSFLRSSSHLVALKPRRVLRAPSVTCLPPPQVHLLPVRVLQCRPAETLRR